jgi:16S rRNA (uracil1498-N3)-methyltransferase
MRTYRCYHPEAINPQKDLTLSSAASHHLSTVLRAKAGSPIEVFDVNGSAYAGTLLVVAKRVTVNLQRALVNKVESPLALHLVQAIGKNDKIDWVIQKAVELGVSEITLLLTERTEVRVPEDQWLKKMTRWQDIVINAVEQSGRTRVPRLNAPIAIEDFFAQESKAEVALILHVHSDGCLKDILPASFTAAEVLIGPEGGFSEAEVTQAISKGYLAVAMGPRVLRTETAPLAILSVLQYVQGDF